MEGETELDVEQQDLTSELPAADSWLPIASDLRAAVSDSFLVHG